MNLLDKYSCIFCKYKKEDRNICQSHGKCNSLSNIYYGILLEYFPFKQIDDLLTGITYKKYNKYYEEINKKYGDYSLENDDYKFIWGIKSYDCLSRSDCNMETMNDIDIIYDKKKEVYILEIETAYTFDNENGECKYLLRLLKSFTKYMDDNDLNKNSSFEFFMSNPRTDLASSSIEKLYTQFRIFVEGFCVVNNYQE